MALKVFGNLPQPVSREPGLGIGMTIVESVEVVIAPFMSLMMLQLAPLLSLVMTQRPAIPVIPAFLALMVP
jgi:hypothetical protein